MICTKHTNAICGHTIRFPNIWSSWYIQQPPGIKGLRRSRHQQLFLKFLKIIYHSIPYNEDLHTLLGSSEQARAAPQLFNRTCGDLYVRTSGNRADIRSPRWLVRNGIRSPRWLVLRTSGHRADLYLRTSGSPHWLVPRTSGHRADLYLRTAGSPHWLVLRTSGHRTDLYVRTSGSPHWLVLRTSGHRTDLYVRTSDHRADLY